MAGNDTGIPAGNILERVVIAGLGIVSVWAARHWGWKKKREETSASREQHEIDVAFAERRVIYENQRDDIERLEKRIERLEAALDERDVEIDRLRDERNEARHKEAAARQVILAREWTIRLQAMELVKHVEYDARIERLEQQVRELGGKPTNGH